MALSIHERTIASRDKVGVVSSSVSIGVTNDFYLAAVAVVATIVPSTALYVTLTKYKGRRTKKKERKSD